MFGDDLGKRITNEDLMKRIEKLEIQITFSSIIFLLYSLAIAFLIGYFSVEGSQGNLFLVLGITLYFFGIILSYRIKKNKEKRRN